MKPHKKYRLYVRRANGKEKARSLRIALRLAFYSELGRPFYVMVMRGFPNEAIAVGKSKRDIESEPLLVASGSMTFRRWAKCFSESISRMRKS